MNFASATYLVFLVLTYVAYWRLGTRERQNALLAFCSYLFYGWWDPRFCLLMMASTFVDYYCAGGIAKSKSAGVRKSLVVFSLVANLGLLAFFKYFNFFQDSLIAAVGTFGIQLEPFTLSIILPVGISFYTFQTLSYTIDVYRGKLEPARNFIDYVVYVSFFPQLVAGPIERGSRMMPQLREPRVFEKDNVVMGLQQIVWGLFKKTVIASNVAPIVDKLFEDLSIRSGPEIWLGAFCFAIQIYCDFSGYSDIAIGSARLLGIRLMRNFAFPYFSQSLREFWRRWHISLSTWFRDYVFIPLGGSRVSTWRCHMNLFIVFIISGLWHGASWNYVIWGAIHGGLLIVESLFLKSPQLKSTDSPAGERLIPKLQAVLRMAAVFFVVIIAWVFFRIVAFDDACLAISKMFTDWRMPEFENMNYSLTMFRGVKIPLIFFGIEWISRKHEVPFFALNTDSPIARGLGYIACTFVFWLVFFFKPTNVGEFIYFQF